MPTPLSCLLDERRADERPVAFGREGDRNLGDLRRDVAGLAAALGDVRGRALLLHCDDAYAFAVGIFAAAATGARAILPPSRQPGALRQLAGEVHGALSDSEKCPEALEGMRWWHPLRVPGGRPADAPTLRLDRDAPLLTLFTSGTTGSGQRVAKALRHLDDEVAVLEETIGASLAPTTRILSTVAPHHLYGLLFRVAWPLHAGRPFLRSAAKQPEELAPHTDAEAKDWAVVTTPVALRHLVERGEFAKRRAPCRAIFSSGAPLSAELARRARQTLGQVPWEIYGSTETGGIALRQQERGDEAWQPMPGVRIEEDPENGCLAVTSPFATGTPADGGERALTGDRVELRPDGSFALRGRADRTIKVGDKRLALPELETRLAAHPAVAEAAAIALEAPSQENRVGAVVVPSVQGWETLRDQGRRALARKLAEHLAADFDRVLLPRSWRFVSALPRNAQGKLPSAALRALFDADSVARTPERLAAERGPHRLDLHLRIPWDLAFLDGHYPSAPLVPGVAQLHFAMQAVEEMRGEATRPGRIEALKFQELLSPGQEARLRVRLSEDGARFDFRLEDAADPERVFSSGRGVLESAP